MYKVLCDGTTICDSRVEELALIDPVVSLEENKAGSFTFKMPKNHPYIDLIQKRLSVIEVWDDDALIFHGSCTECEKDFYNTKKYYCEGALAWLNDSVQRPARYQGATVRGFLEALIANHNAQVDSFKQFQVGVVTVEDGNDSLYRYTNMESTMECLKEDLVDDLGGIIRVRHEDGIMYIDYLAEYVNTNSQIIRFGKNLLDLSSNIDSADIATAIIPLGATQEEGSEVEGLETKLTIKDVNDGLDYVYSAEAVKNYGWIYKTVEWDDVTTPDTLKSKGEKYLSDIQFENMVIEAKAVDMHIVEGSVEAFKIGDSIRVLSEPHGLDRYFPLTKQKIYLAARDKNNITLGKSERLSFTAKNNAANAEIKKKVDSVPSKSDLLLQAQENASNLIKMATNGYIVLNMDDNGNPKELLIMDTNDIETATKVWRWNINGLGYSSTGYYGNFGKAAITMDGAIVADFITTGTMQADRIKGGTLKLGGGGNGNGVAQIVDASGNVLITLDNKGITLAEGVQIAWSNISGTEDIATTNDIPDDEHITQITKNTLKTETVEAKNLQIKGGSVNITTSSDSENYMELTNGVGTATYKPHLVRIEKADGTEYGSFSYWGCSSTLEDAGAIFSALLSSGALSFSYNGTQQLQIIARADGYTEYKAKTGHEFKGNVNITTDSDVLMWDSAAGKIYSIRKLIQNAEAAGISCAL